MTNYQNLLYEANEGVGLITINRPQALNALNTATIQELDSILTEIAADTAVQVVIITGGGDKAFVAGADISEMESMSAITGREWGKLGQAVFAKLEKLPQPVIAAINGFALGGGCELCMACDVRIAADNAQFGQPEVTLGITPGFGGTQRLARIVGVGRAKELLYTGDRINAAEAYRIGLVNKIVPAPELLDRAKELARKIITRAPVAVRLCKSAVNVGMNLDIDSAVAYEAEIFGLCFATRDQKEGMAAFLGKRRPQFTGD